MGAAILVLIADLSSCRVFVRLAMFAIVAVFWLALYQNGFTLTFWARDNTVTPFAPETFQSVEPLGVIVFSGAFVGLCAWLGRRGLVLRLARTHTRDRAPRVPGPLAPQG